MGKNKQTPKQQMKYWRVQGLIIKARTARVAVRKYLRGNLLRDVVTRDYELDNPFGGGETFEELMASLKRSKWGQRVSIPAIKRWAAAAASRVSATRANKP